jgi:tripartite-type tricarboxylate transporter receptor subunit TctC
LRDAVAKAVAVTELRNRFAEQGIELIASASSEEFAAFLRKQVEEFAVLAREAGMTAK